MYNCLSYFFILKIWSFLSLKENYTSSLQWKQSRLMLDCLIILKDAILGPKGSNWYFVFRRKCFVIIFSWIQNTVVGPNDLPFILMSIGETSVYWDTPRNASLNSQIHLYLKKQTKVVLTKLSTEIISNKLSNGTLKNPKSEDFQSICP